MMIALASERRSTTERMKAGTERRPLASTALSALPLKRCSSSTPVPTHRPPPSTSAHRRPRVAFAPNRKLPLTKCRWITEALRDGKGFHAFFGDFMPLGARTKCFRRLFSITFAECSRVCRPVDKSVGLLAARAEGGKGCQRRKNRQNRQQQRRPPIRIVPLPGDWPGCAFPVHSGEAIEPAGK